MLIKCTEVRKSMTQEKKDFFVLLPAATGVTEYGADVFEHPVCPLCKVTALVQEDTERKVYY